MLAQATVLNFTWFCVIPTYQDYYNALKQQNSGQNKNIDICFAMPLSAIMIPSCIGMFLGFYIQAAAVTGSDR